MEIKVNLREDSYSVYIEKHSLYKANEYFNISRKVMIVTDSGVPYKYAETLAECCGEPYILLIPEGENSKSMMQYTYISKMLLNYGFTRSDCVVALGGGVIGDLAGFAASTYMRGIDFYNIPTTLLSQIDASIGGKVAIDFCGLKNIIGAFYQPKGVLIDPELLTTLNSRQISNGLAESIKMAATSDAELFSLFEEQNDYMSFIDEIIYRSVMIKKNIVEKDEKETGLRRVLNFGHTVGHFLETISKGKLLHGEAVALGMIPMCSKGMADRLVKVLEKAHLPTSTDISIDSIEMYMIHDKKIDGEFINAVYVETPGECNIVRVPLSGYLNDIKSAYPYQV